MLFKTDENLPVEVNDVFKQLGHDAITIADQQLAGKTDVQVSKVCLTEKRAIVTLNLDFSDIRAYPPADYHGIIVFRPAVQNITSLLRLTNRVVRLLSQEPLAGHLWIVDDSRVRIRGGRLGTP